MISDMDCSFESRSWEIAIGVSVGSGSRRLCVVSKRRLSCRRNVPDNGVSGSDWECADSSFLKIVGARIRGERVGALVFGDTL